MIAASFRRLDPELAHRLGLLALRMVPWPRPRLDPRLSVRTLGLDFPSPLGLAAGFDKDATALAGLARLGFGALEAGTVTLRPQPGNPRPRLFRLPEDASVINRMGFNNAGLVAFVKRLARRSPDLPIGVNIGPNREAADPLRDLPAMLCAVVGLADWVTVNVSSPNTPGLRDLQAPDRIAGILRALAAVAGCPPLLVKLSPDTSPDSMPEIVAACREAGAAGLVLTNTTLARPPLRGRHSGQEGGLSGAALAPLAVAMLERVAGLGSGLVLVAAGGIATGADVVDRLRRGASLVQAYTAFAYAGPGFPARIARETLAALDAGGYVDCATLIGSDPWNSSTASLRSPSATTGSSSTSGASSTMA